MVFLGVCLLLFGSQGCEGIDVKFGGRLGEIDWSGYFRGAPKAAFIRD